MLKTWRMLQHMVLPHLQQRIEASLKLQVGMFEGHVRTGAVQALGQAKSMPLNNST